MLEIDRLQIDGFIEKHIVVVCRRRRRQRPLFVVVVVVVRRIWGRIGQSGRVEADPRKLLVLPCYCKASSLVVERLNGGDLFAIFGRQWWWSVPWDCREFCGHSRCLFRRRSIESSILRPPKMKQVAEARFARCVAHFVARVSLPHVLGLVQNFGTLHSKKDIKLAMSQSKTLSRLTKF